MKQTISLVTIIGLLVMGSYMLFEPELARAVEDTTAVSLTVTSEITVDCDAACDMTTGGPINAISGGSLTGDFTCTVETPDSTGWNLTIKKDTVLKTGAGGENNQFDDITPSTPLDYTWSTVGSGLEEFGFNIKATSEDTLQKYCDAGASPCDVGTTPTDDHCWDAVPTTPATKVSSSNAATDPAGDAVNFGLKAEAGGSNFLEPGAYTATITATATVGP